ncbi:MAG TPA: leucine--tRNA ligase [Gaiellaceae bacterium]|nr:leucine--tRNA ligase [Gaiellaceae bacterium]
MERYDPTAIEAKWQKVWEDARAFYVDNPDATQHDDTKSYVLEMLPYPSGELHMGHVLNYTLGDVLTHHRRRNGLMVLRPMGFDAFGLPAENAAIKEGIDPQTSTDANIAKITSQMKRLGWAIDWPRVVSTHDPDFYRWTQWLFLRFFERGLAYKALAPVKWCPNDQTVLANEQVEDGRCFRCGWEVEARNLEQWMFAITRYADELLDEMSLLESWPERILTMQRNWIGRSEGADILFRVPDLDRDIEVFTTRPDTVFGATFFVLAPEHPLIPALVAGLPEEQAALDYAKHAAARSTADREQKEKDGVFTGRYAINPATGDRIPIWIADYVLMEYGTGAIMGVPAHDERDHAFAEKYSLPIVQVVAPASAVEPAEQEAPEQGAFVAHSPNEVLVNSGEFSGLPAPEAKQKIVDWLHGKGLAAPAIRFRLRDWLISRQRYWGCPIPIVSCGACGLVPVPDDQLPVVLPHVDDYLPKGKSPLAAAEDWVATTCPKCGGPARRETDTMDTFVDSSWYFIRYADPRNDQEPWQPALANYWLPVNQYIGGAEHAVLHLLYSRFFVKVLQEMGLLDFREPFLRLFNQGDVRYQGKRMSKSRGNVISPDDVIDRHGADAVRLYILFMAPADQAMEWTDSGIEGIERFLKRLWRIVHEVIERAPKGDPGAGVLARKTHETIARISDDIGRRFSFNTPIAALMELLNELAPRPDDLAGRFAAETAVSLIQPYAPHVAEELWQKLGHERLWEQPWPAHDPAMLVQDTFELVVQVNGRVRDRMVVPSTLAEAELVERAKASPKVQAFVDGKAVQKAIVVPRKLVNLVVG